MINIDQRLLDKDLFSSEELWLLLHIVKRINKDRKSFPGHELLCADTGYGTNKVYALKSSLLKKGLLEIRQRKGKDGTYSSNEYTIMTDMISVFVPVSKIKTRSKEADGVTATVTRSPCHGDETDSRKPLDGEGVTDSRIPLDEVLVLNNTIIEVLVCNDDDANSVEFDTHTIEKNSNKLSKADSPPRFRGSPPEADTLFRETKYGGSDGLKLFEVDMIARNADFETVDLGYYYHKVLNWSDQGHRKRNWLASAATFILNDYKDKKLQLKKYETTTINGYPIADVADYIDRINKKYRKGG
jgi:hypothetical protein